MSDDMSNIMKNFSNMLNSKDMPDNIKELFNSVNNKNTDSEGKNEKSNNFDFSNIDFDTIMKIQKIISAMNSEQDNSRSNLLRSLKPYLKPSRQSKVDQYIQLFKMEKLIETLNHNGGDLK